MYFWNINALVKDLREDKVSEKEKLKYYLFISILGVALPHSIDLFTILDIGVLIIGTYLCYEVNSKGDNRYFIDRMICLGVPLSLRFILPFFVLILTIGIIFHNANNIELILNIFGIFSLIIYYMFLRYYLAKVSQPELPIQDNNLSAN